MKAKTEIIWEGTNARVTKYTSRKGDVHYCGHWRYVKREWINGRVFSEHEEKEAIEWTKSMDVC